MKAHLVHAAAALAIGVVMLAAPAGAPALAQTGSARAELRTAVFDIENMTCALCPVTVKRAIEGVDGVRSVEVDYGSKTATALFDPLVAAPDAIGAASAMAGYPASPRG